MSVKDTRPTQSSDAAVFAKARSALDGCPTVPSSVHVHVTDDVVTLTGSVQRPAERGDAEHAVRPVIGTRRLMNNITVTQAPAPDGFGPPDDRG